jgi:CDP-glucose 4,6-dehydratase
LEKLVSLDLTSRIDNSFWNGKRVLVTGHTGFKGSWLTIWLQKLGCNVTGISLAPSTNPSLYELAGLAKLCVSHIVDIRDLKSLKQVFEQSQPQVVFHLAAQALVRPSYSDPLETFSTNVMGTANILEAMRELTSVESAIMVTTDKVYRNNDSNKPYNEDDILGGHDPYSASKAASELVIDCFRNSFLKDQKINIASARAGNVIGGGDWARDRIIPDAIRAWGSKGVLKIRHPHSIRPWQHVLEPLYGYIKLAHKLKLNSDFSKSYNFGPSTEKVASVEKVITLAQASWGGGQVEADLNSNPLKETAILRLDTSAAQRDLGVMPIWNIEQSVSRAINWYTKQINGANAFDLCIDDIREFESALNQP